MTTRFAVLAANSKQIIQLASPLFLGQLATIAFGVIDTSMVGRTGAIDLGALALAGSIYISVYIGLMGVLQALAPIAGQLQGAKQYPQIGEEIRQSAWLAVLLSIVGCAVLWFPQPLLSISGSDAALLQRATDYLHALAWGLPAALGFRIFSFFNTAISRPMVVTCIQLAVLSLKIPLNLLFIAGFWIIPAQGGVGCGWASSLLNWVGFLCGLVWLTWRPHYTPYAIFTHFSRPNWVHILELFKLGAPMGLSYLIEVTAFAFMALFIARLGATPLAGHQIISNLGTVLYMLPLSLAIATSTLVAQAIGRRQLEQARRIGWSSIQLAALIASVVGMAIWLARKPLLAVYTPNLQIQTAAMPLFLFIASFQIFDAIQVQAGFILRAYKVTFVPTLIYAFALWGVGLGGGYLLGENVFGNTPTWLLGASGYWLANAVSLGLTAVCLVSYFQHISRKALRQPARVTP